MSLDAREKSTHQAAPIEVYRFASGTQTWNFTSSDGRVTLNVPGIGVELFEPEALSRGEPEYSQEDQSGSIKITLPRLNPIAVLLMAGLPAAPVSLTIYRHHEDDGEVIVLFVGKIVQALFSGAQAELMAAPLSQILRRRIPRTAFQKACNRLLYGPGCDVARSSFTDPGTVLSVSGVTVQAAVFATRADGWYEAGYLERLDGSRQYVTAHAGNTVTLQYPFFGLAVGETIKGIAGCRRREKEDCTDKFNNLVNHLGFKRIPSKNPYHLGMS